VRGFARTFLVTFRIIAATRLQWYLATCNEFLKASEVASTNYFMSQGPKKIAMKSEQDVSAVRLASAELGPLIRASADEMERERCLLPPIVQALKQAGVFGMAMPQAWGGPELDLLEQVRVIETLAEFDGSVGWCALVGSVGGFISSWLAEDAARELFYDLNASSAGSIFVAGKATRVPGGYRVSGRWPFASGCQHSAIFVLTCQVHDNERKSLLNDQGVPTMRLVYVRASEIRVVDTWYSTGLRGTGSHDVELCDVFVPESFTINFPDVRARRPEPLYAHPYSFIYVFVGVALGVARAAIKAFIDIANRREITIAALGGQRVLLRTSAHAQVAISQAEGLVRSSRAHVFDVLSEIWATLKRGEPLSQQLRASYAAAITNTHRSCTNAVDLLYKANGGSSVYSHGPLDRCFRDMHTINQHHAASLAFDEKAGQVMLGLQPADQVF
jgi:indole-3-acetate monooxygenase